ncbi:MAG TPA: hypothetical protein VEV19_10670 [Ktedonobacteraceae bacterium]|nr:hypothetical protein [Ktedonobacteraceae bacterium]
MESVSHAYTQAQPQPAKARPLISSRLFSWCFLVACYCLLLGITLDAWAHNHVPRLETFFTPWHAVLYSGLLSTALILPGTILINRLRGASWRDAVPFGYAIAVVGVIGSILGGLGDMTWHILFGVEQNVDAQFSPTHIALMLFFGLLIISPYYALYSGKRSTTPLMLVLSFTLFLTYWSIISQTAHPYTRFWLTDTSKVDPQGLILAVVSYVFQGGFLAIFSMYTIRRWRLFPGFYTLALTISALPIATMRDTYIVIPIALVSGILIDCAYRLLRPTMQRKEHFRLFIALVPGLWLTTYTITLCLAYGTVWSAHMLGGSIVVTIIISWLLSGLFFPPPIPQEQEP